MYRKQKNKTCFPEGLDGLRKRNLELMDSKKLSDCRFLVGSDPSNQKIIAAHKLILAAASPVFEAMFYGELEEKSDPIPIPDIQSDIFEDMLTYMYTDYIDISTSDRASQLCYAAKKYLLVDVVKKCCDYISSILSWKNACEIYEFAVRYDELNLKHESMSIIKTYAQCVIENDNFTNIQMSTLLDIFDQDFLDINSEYELYKCLLRFANKNYYILDKNKIIKTANNSESFDDDNVNDIATATLKGFDHLEDEEEIAIFEKAFKKIRFLSMTPKNFAEGPANCRFMKMHEALAIFLIISRPLNADYPVPEGFCGCLRNMKKNSGIKEKCKIHNN